MVIPPPITTTTTTTTNLTSANGTYSGTLTATANSCGFSGSAAVRGVLTVDSNGRGTWEKTHVGPNVTFRFNVTLTSNGSGGFSFNGSTSQKVGSTTFNVSDVATIAGKVMTITQTFTSTSGETCTVRYTGQISRS